MSPFGTPQIGFERLAERPLLQAAVRGCWCSLARGCRRVHTSLARPPSLERAHRSASLLLDSTTNLGPTAQGLQRLLQHIA